MKDSRDSASSPRKLERRTMLRACCAFALAGAAAGPAHSDEAADAAATDESLAPPQENDVLVFAFGERAGQSIAPADLALGAKQVLAYPMNPATRRVRDGTRLNQLVVVRVEAAALSAETAARSADGIVAYSGVCTHTGCDVTDWRADAQNFKCPCHESEFDPRDGARVVSGPAPWQLAALPLKVADGAVVVAAPFVGEVGFAQPELAPFGP